MKLGDASEVLLRSGISAKVMAGWIGAGALSARALVCTIDGKPSADRALPPSAWDGAIVSWRAGSMRAFTRPGGVWLEAHGIEVNRAQFELLTPTPMQEPDAPLNVASTKGPEHPNWKAEAWDGLVLALLAIALDGRLNRSSFRSQRELRQELLAEIKDGLSESSIKPLVSQVWRRFVEVPDKGA